MLKYFITVYINLGYLLCSSHHMTPMGIIYIQTSLVTLVDLSSLNMVSSVHNNIALSNLSFTDLGKGGTRVIIHFKIY